MTSLGKRKSKLVFQTEDAKRERGRFREVVIEAHPGYADIRLKGLRSSYTISWVGIYDLAVRLAVEQKRREKKERKGK